ncbi:acyltransferase [Mucilaginibacter sp. HMF5004]|uniref:acyltransferase family protein n=1 Tax=Mucilaginibacter rivuli TaxID=2857527 RepID=UPI001C5F4FEE|nr:acyltransferase [Mucilaginibacter rivuli]MBW4890016.1 acyltransferase [Mucilaginibacter rivuli]
MEQQKDFRINNFDLLRLLAATQVIADHYHDHIDATGNPLLIDMMFSFPGVAIFFVISGYLISASFERNKEFRNYIRNRILRIYPGLWGVVFLTIIAISLTGVSFLNVQALAWLPAQLTGIIYTPGFLNNYGFGSYNGSLWTIPVELQFYLVLPICYYFAPKNKENYWFYTLFIVFVSIYLSYQFIDFGHTIHKLLQYSFLPHFYMFLLGVIFQRLRIYKSKFIYNKALYWLVAYLAISLTLKSYFNPVLFVFAQNIILGFTALSMAYTLPGFAHKLLRGNDISYGIYIYHGLLLTLAVQLKLQEHISLPLVILATYILAYCSWIFIEKPFINRKKQSIKV